VRGYSTTDKISYWLFSDHIPLTKALIVLNIATFILMALFRQSIGAYLNYFLGFDTISALKMPWTFVTYPIIAASGGVISILFSAYWLWMAGGSLERSWGTQRFAMFFLLASVISAAGLFAGGVVISTLFAGNVPHIFLAGLWLPIAAVTIAFAMLNPEQQIMFMFVLPLKLKYLALIDVVMVLVSYGSNHILLGIFALAGCAYAYWFVRPGRFSMPARKQRGEVVRVFDKPNLLRRLNPFTRIKEYRDKQKLKKLFERSFNDNEDEK